MGTLLNRRRVMGGGGGVAPAVDYFALTAVDNCVFTLTIPAAVDSSCINTISYSLDGGNTWVTTENDSSEVVITTPSVSAGNTVVWKGDVHSFGKSDGVHASFSGSGRHTVSGNISYLFTSSDTITTSYHYIFAGMFDGDSNLTSAELLDIPDTGYSQQYTCAYMFRNCTSLTKTPILKWNRLGARHFSYCFYGCSLLDSITMTASNMSASYCLYRRVQNVAATGTFTKKQDITNGTGKLISRYLCEKRGDTAISEFKQLSLYLNRNDLWKPDVVDKENFDEELYLIFEKINKIKFVIKCGDKCDDCNFKKNIENWIEDPCNKCDKCNCGLRIGHALEFYELINEEVFNANKYDEREGINDDKNNDLEINTNSNQKNEEVKEKEHNNGEESEEENEEQPEDNDEI